MTHIVDEEYRGHEIVFIQQNDGFITVDVRVDNFDGEMLTGYEGIINVAQARSRAHGFIDGYHAGKLVKATV